MVELVLWLFGLGLKAVAVDATLVPYTTPACELVQAHWPSTPKFLQHEVSASFSGNPLMEPLAPKKSCSINVANYDLAKVLQELSAQTKSNLILLSPADTKLTLRLVNVTVDEMLRHICAVAGLAYLRAGDAYVLGTEDQLKKAYAKEYQAKFGKPEVSVQEQAPPEQIAETYIVRYVDAAQLATALGKLFPNSGLNVVSGAMETSPTLASKDTSTSTGVAAGVIEKEKPNGSEAGKMLVFMGPPDAVRRAMELARRMDYPRSQVGITVTIHDISNEALRDLGLTWSYSNLSFTETNPKALGLGSFTRAPLSFLGALHALETQDQAKLLASPNVSVLDGERAFVLIGSRLNFPVLVGYSQANTPIFDVKEERVGIYLQVAASIGDSDNITMTLYPQVSAVTKFINAGGASYPQIDSREAQTTLRVKSGETIVMAGLYRDEELRQIEKVPLLGDIPLFGELFKRRKTTKSSSQVIITITPVIISTP
jgi:type II secretory pathway component GspD/PulD (secretin)